MSCVTVSGEPLPQRASDDCRKEICAEGRLTSIEDLTEVGVDLEVVREVPEADGIAASTFTAEERAAWAAAGGGAAGFLRVWTRKEALLKALGVGVFGGVTLFGAPLW